MQIVVLLAFIIALSTPCLLPQPVSAGGCIWVVSIYLLVAAGLELLDVRLAQPGRGGTIFPRFPQRHRMFAMTQRAWLLAGLAGIVAAGYRDRIGDDLHLWNVPLLGDVLVLAPFFAALTLMWTLEYPFHRASRLGQSLRRIRAGGRPLPCWTRWEYVLFNVRTHLLFIAVPVGLILLGLDIIRLYVDPLLAGRAGREAAYLILSLSVVGGVFLLAPALIVRIWKTRSLPSGDLREGLEFLCRQMRVGFRDLRIWETGGVLANAGAMGLGPRLRYILLSDALLEEMPPPQLRAIFAHEVAHIRHQHVLYAGLFAVSAGTISLGVGWCLARWLGLAFWQEELVSLTILAAAWGAGFGYVSKRFERHSDVVGAWAGRAGGVPKDDRIEPEGAAIFAEALRRVGELNGIAPDQRNWRHGRLRDRVDFIRRLGASAGSRRPTDRLVRRIQRGLWLATALGVGLLSLLATGTVPVR